MKAGGRLQAGGASVGGGRTTEAGVQSVAELKARGVVALTKAQMAAALQISVRSLNGMMARDEIDCWRITPRLVRFRVEHAVRRMDETVLRGKG